jgi:trk system potassium uptake protein
VSGDGLLGQEPGVSARAGLFGRDGAAVAHDLGAVLLVPAGMAAASVPVAIWAGDRHSVAMLVATASITAGVAATLLWRFNHVRAVHRWPAVEVIALGWLLTALVTAIVLFGLGLTAPLGSADVAFAEPLSALVEGMSGITGTGLTMVAGQEAELTATAQWWRSLSQWVGGVGMVIFALGLTTSTTGMRTLYEAEGRHPDLPGGITGTVRGTAALYLGMTVLAVTALAMTEHDAWEALNHGLSAVSTGGFTITGDSMAGYATTTQAVVLVVMSLGAVSFVVHHILLVQRRPAHGWRLTPLRAQVTVLVGGAAILLGPRALADTDVASFDAVFQWASAAGTAGFSTDPDLARWPGVLLVPLIAIMFVGASSGSTGGGWKLDRLVWLLKALRRRVGGDDQLHWDGGPVRRHEANTLVSHAGTLGALWLLTLLAGVGLLVALTDAPLQLVVFDTASTLSNVGLSAGVVDGNLTAPAKLVLTALMYLGRLELLTALLLATQSESSAP